MFLTRTSEPFPRWSQQGGGGGHVISRQRRSTFTHPKEGNYFEENYFCISACHVFIEILFFYGIRGLRGFNSLMRQLCPPTLHPPSCTQRRHLYITVTFLHCLNSSFISCYCFCTHVFVLNMRPAIKPSVFVFFFFCFF